MTYQINQAHTGYSQTTLHLPLAQAWAVDFDGPVSYPLIARGRAYVTVADAAGYGTSLQGFDLRTGAPLWDPIALSGTYFWSNAAYDRGRIFVLNFDGLLRAFDAKTGNPSWSTQLAGQYAFSAPPSPAGGLVFVGGAGSGGTLYAVDARDGSVRWTASVENGDISSPAIVGGVVYVSYACQQTYAFDLDTGNLVWHHSTGCEGGGGKTPAVHRGLLYDRDFEFDAPAVLDAGTGTFVASFPFGAIPAFVGNTGYFLSSSFGAAPTLEAHTIPYESASWRFTGDDHLVTAPVVAGRYAIVGSSEGTVFAVDRRTGAQLWSAAVGAAIPGPDEQNVSQPLTGLAVAEHTLLVPASNRLVAYR